MAKDKGGDKPKPPPGNQLLECPNFRVCGTNVRANQRGNSHKYGVLENGEIVYKNCTGG